MIEYKPGDRIIMLPSANDRYAITKAGRTGTIIRRIHINSINSLYTIHFDATESRRQTQYNVSSEHFTLLSPMSKEERVLNKIKILWNNSKYVKKYNKEY